MYTMRYLADLALRPHTSIVSIKTLILVQLRLIGSDIATRNKFLSLFTLRASEESLLFVTLWNNTMLYMQVRRLIAVMGLALLYWKGVYKLNELIDLNLEGAVERIW